MGLLGKWCGRKRWRKALRRGKGGGGEGGLNKWNQGKIIEIS